MDKNAIYYPIDRKADSGFKREQGYWAAQYHTLVTLGICVLSSSQFLDPQQSFEDNLRSIMAEGEKELERAPGSYASFRHPEFHAYRAGMHCRLRRIPKAQQRFIALETRIDLNDPNSLPLNRIQAFDASLGTPEEPLRLSPRTFSFETFSHPRLDDPDDVIRCKTAIDLAKALRRDCSYPSFGTFSGPRSYGDDVVSGIGFYIRLAASQDACKIKQIPLIVRPDSDLKTRHDDMGYMTLARHNNLTRQICPAAHTNPLRRPEALFNLMQWELVLRGRPIHSTQRAEDVSRFLNDRLDDYKERPIKRESSQPSRLVA